MLPCTRYQPPSAPGRPVGDRHRAGTAPGQGRAGNVSGHDRVPHGGVAQRVGEVGGIATREVNETGTGNLRRQCWVVGVGPRAHVDHDLFDAEPLGLRLAKLVPAVE